MPFKIEKVEGKRCYRVLNTETGEEHDKCSTKKNAEAQMRLLQDVEQGKGMCERVSEDTQMPEAKPPKKAWRQFYGEGIRGKKFGSRQEVNAFMKEMATKFKSL